MPQYEDRDGGDGDEEEGESEIPAMQKIGILFVALGQEIAGEVMKFLTDYEIEEITQSVANLKNVSVEQQDKVMEEFEQHLLAGEWVSTGGMDFARGALERAVGPRKAQEILDRVASTVSSGFYLLKNVAPEQVAPFISHEQILLREVDQKDLVVALKAAEEELKDKILGNMSERVRTFISEEMEFLGPMRLSEVEEVQLRIVQQVRQLEEQGQVTIVRGDADDSFV